MKPLDVAYNYDEWFNRVSRIAYRERLFEDKTKNTSGSFLWVLLYQALVFVSIFVYFINHHYDNPMVAAEAGISFLNMLVLLPEVFIYNACSGGLKKLSPEGVEIKARAEALRNWLSQIPQGIEDARRWDEMFVWVVALGVPPKVCRNMRGTWRNVYTRDDEFSVAMDIEDLVFRALKEKDKANGRKEVAGTEFYQTGI